MPFAKKILLSRCAVISIATLVSQPSFSMDKPDDEYPPDSKRQCFRRLFEPSSSEVSLKPDEKNHEEERVFLLPPLHSNEEYLSGKCERYVKFAMEESSDAIEFSNQINMSIKPFWFMRHGQTADNKDQLISGQRDTQLDEEGRKQAFKAGKTLKNIGIKKIISSDLSRAKETAEIICKSLELNVPIQIVKELAERNWGAIDGKPAEDYKTRWDLNYEPQEGESFSIFQKRVMNAFFEVMSKGEDGILIIAHGGIYRILMSFIGVSHMSFGDKPTPNNATPLYFVPPATDADKWEVEVLDSVKKI